MFSSRNIHFTILGVILGAASGYVFAFYQVQRKMPAPQVAAANSGGPTAGLPQNHPNVSNDQMLGLFKAALDKNPNDPELMVRYANFLFDFERYDEAVAWYQKVLALQPNNVDVRTDMGTSLYSMGKIEEAMAEYQKSASINPNHMLTLHNMVVALSGAKKDFTGAEAILKKMEQINPTYEGLPALRKELEEDRARAAR